MHVQFTRGTALGGLGNDAHPGDVRELPDAQAERLIAAGRAVAVPAPEPEKRKARSTPRGATIKKEEPWTS